ncbi:PilZ domain-containing protein [Gammaproteobacteria bacterium]
MEHRWSLRIPIRINVNVIFAEVGESPAVTRDLSLGGVFLEMLGPPRPPKYASVELLFPVGNGEDQTHYQINAGVVRETADGIGLMFRDYDVSTLPMLQQIIVSQDMTTH